MQNEEREDGKIIAGKTSGDGGSICERGIAASLEFILSARPKNLYTLPMPISWNEIPRYIIVSDFARISITARTGYAFYLACDT
ncbi:MAG: hypothetical protein ABSG78_14815 [Verrucomicrobiota bacterium]|jgi:hypothetical protein